MELLLDILKWSVIVGTAALALTLLKPLLDKRYSAKWRYGVWLAMAAFLLLAPVRWEALVPEAPVTPPVVIEVPQLEVSVSRQEGLSIQRPAVVPMARPAGTAAAKKTAVFPLDRMLTGLWLAGMGAFLAYHLLGTWYFNRRAKRWSRRAGEDALQIYEAVRQELGLQKAPPLRVSTAVDSPMVIGLFRPLLLLPGEDFGPEELAFILRHELTHYRRRDLWYKLALLAANALHWFNPLVWLLRREAERDLELTCDDAVVAGRGEKERRAYSEALLSSIHRQKGLSRAALSTHFYGGKEVMMERFRNILGTRGRKWGGLALALALLAVVAAACAVGVKSSNDGALSPEELAAWQEKVESQEMDRYIWKMYTDVAYLPPEEVYDELTMPGTDNLGHEDVNPKVLSGTMSGDTVTLEIEGNFASRLPTGTLTLVNEEPVSFTTPLHTAVETAARELMENTAEGLISSAKEYGKDLEFTEKYVTNLFCSESMTFDGKTYYVWELYYVMKPNDIDNVVFAGGMDARNGWVTSISSPGSPILILSVDEGGKIVLEEQTWSSSTSETGYTWEEYVYCALHLGMGEMTGILNGWPELNTPFMESIRNGHETWAMDWQDAAHTYLERRFGMTADGGVTSLRTFTADEDINAHDQAVLAQAVCGDTTVTLLLANISYPVEVWNTTIRYWQVCGVKWDPPLEEQSGLTGTHVRNVRDANAWLYEANGAALALPHAYNWDFIVNPKNCGHVNEADTLFELHHRETFEKYMSLEGYRWGGWVLSIKRCEESVYQELAANTDYTVYPFAALGRSTYCVVIPTDPGCPPDVQAEVDAFLTSQEYWDMLADFVERNGLEALASADDPPVSEVTADEMVSLTSYFNVTQHNGLLRFPYSSFEDVQLYLGVLFYDMGEPVTDEEERAAAAEAFGGTLETDCTKLSRQKIGAYLESNFYFPDVVDWLGFDVNLMDILGPYLEEYDAFYMVHGDTMWSDYEMERAERNPDGTINLYYTTDLWQIDGWGGMDMLWDQPMCARMIPSGDFGWRIIANTIVE